jgi:peptidoglycan hydrolase CwlO-like protein
MSTLIILAIQSKGAAILIIIALLLGAAIIGYLSAWFYSKSIYEKKIDIIQAEKDELDRQIAGLNEEISKLQENLDEKDKEIEKLTKGKKS